MCVGFAPGQQEEQGSEERPEEEISSNPFSSSFSQELRISRFRVVSVSPVSQYSIVPAFNSEPLIPGRAS